MAIDGRSLGSGSITHHTGPVTLSHTAPRPTYLDNILIYSQTLEEHVRHVRRILQLLLENRLYVKLEKSVFYMSMVSFLGFVVSKGILHMDPAEIRAIVDWPHPTSLRLVQCFLGFTNFFRCFMRNFSSSLTLPGRPQGLFVGPSKPKSFQGDQVMVNISPVLQLPDPEEPFVIEILSPLRWELETAIRESLQQEPDPGRGSPGVPPSKGNTVILVLMDRFSKACKFVALHKLPSATETAGHMLQLVVRMHGKSCDLCLISTNPSSWAEYLPWAEYAHNTLQHSSLGMSPFECQLGFPPPMYTEGTRGWGSCCRAICTASLLTTTKARKQVEHHKRRPAPTFWPSQQVWLSAKDLPLHVESKKLIPRYVGPFKVDWRINPVIYQLRLLPSMQIHPIFHVSRFRLFLCRTLPPELHLIIGFPAYIVRRLLDSIPSDHPTTTRTQPLLLLFSITLPSVSVDYLRKEKLKGAGSKEFSPRALKTCSSPHLLQFAYKRHV
ncbi:hypothetical protein AOLI_G00288130 [Acnodon oligacanthus]